MSLLDGRFSILATQHHNDTSYSYQCKYESLVFYSSRGIPLAAISIKCADQSNTKIIMPPRSDRTFADFQGIITEDNQEFKFVITNLTDLGLVKVDIMKNNTAVEDVDPGLGKGGLNRVNELHERQSYLIH